MKKIVYIFLVVASFHYSQVFAWGDVGHKLIALIAYDQLTPAERNSVLTILKSHPQYTDLFAIPANLTGDQKSIDRWRFAQMAVWPDLIRGNKKYHRALWHYVNFPIFPSPADESMDISGVNLDNQPQAHQQEKKYNALQAYSVNSAILKSNSSSPEEKAIALCWIFHLVGDIHQPLHGAALFSEDFFPDGDHGGNFIFVPKKKTTQNLHSTWDKLPGASGMSFGKLNTTLRVYQTPELKATGVSSLGVMDFEEWSKQSEKIAGDKAYTNVITGKISSSEFNDDGTITLSFSTRAENQNFQNYLEGARKVVKTRIAEAGYRLAKVIPSVI